MNYYRVLYISILVFLIIFLVGCQKNEESDPKLNAPLALNATEIEKTSQPIGQMLLVLKVFYWIFQQMMNLLLS